MIWLPRTTDNATYFVQSLGIRGNESRLYKELACIMLGIMFVYCEQQKLGTQFVLNN